MLTHHFFFLDAEHELNEEFFCLLHGVLEDLLNCHDQLIPQTLWHGAAHHTSVILTSVYVFMEKFVCVCVCGGGGYDKESPAPFMKNPLGAPVPLRAASNFWPTVLNREQRLSKI